MILGGMSNALLAEVKDLNSASSERIGMRPLWFIEEGLRPPWVDIGLDSPLSVSGRPKAFLGQMEHV